MAMIEIQQGEVGDVNWDDKELPSEGWSEWASYDNPLNALSGLVSAINADEVDTTNSYYRVVDLDMQEVL